MVEEDESKRKGIREDGSKGEERKGGSEGSEGRELICHLS